jgi:hypothetical protein
LVVRAAGDGEVVYSGSSAELLDGDLFAHYVGGE